MKKLFASVVFALWGVAVIGIEKEIATFDELVKAPVEDVNERFRLKGSSDAKIYAPFDWADTRLSSIRGGTIRGRSVASSDSKGAESEIVQVSALEKDRELQKDSILPIATTRAPYIEEWRKGLHGRMFQLIWDFQHKQCKYDLPCHEELTAGVDNSYGFKSVIAKSYSPRQDERYLQFKEKTGQRYTDITWNGLYQKSGIEYLQYNVKYVQRAVGKFAHQHIMTGGNQENSDPLLAEETIKVPENEGLTAAGRVVVAGVVVVTAAAIVGLLKICSWR